MKINISTTLEETVLARIAKLAAAELISQSAVVRKCIIRHLPQLEREVLENGYEGALKSESKTSKKRGALR